MPLGQISGAAVLDACVLFRGMLTDFLLCLAEAGCFVPIWSDQIHAEWTRNLLPRPGMSIDRIAYRRTMMERTFPSANVPADAILIATVLAGCRTNNERKDAHIVATAMAASAEIIVTDNVNDVLPVVSRVAPEVLALTPDAFCMRLYRRNPTQFAAAAWLHRTSMTRPAFSPDGYLNLLRSNRLGLPRSAELLRPHRLGL